MGAKASKLEKLHELFTAELTRQLKDDSTDPETGARTAPSASFLAVVGNFLSRSNIKPTDDSPAMTALRYAADALPFRVESDGTIKAN